ncbi:LCP family protein [Actinobaculum massiliense]|uniref:Cell envelope-related transcriptional attenuator domain-containing protein n=1 Tax=Actinobaculum massiliense ACS-171-V-Col2 TaxID=883066 RepID=K9F0M7_9ACTO|nr:LCP family protein [Actinobaculum massiliense]EKU95060.1 hypothetical protein HMPREF9233_01198 [Actinobaculum massiliense ACS-171-V-Col2]MDK8318912.1 LCP family protein [Actinobaculum massiliense]MDK8567779.1 LCP family protein [Actinobaculum massiliense]
MSNQPPSFEPRKRQPRPSQSHARNVGGESQPRDSTSRPRSRQWRDDESLENAGKRSEAPRRPQVRRRSIIANEESRTPPSYSPHARPAGANGTENAPARSFSEPRRNRGEPPRYPARATAPRADYTPRKPVPPAPAASPAPRKRRKKRHFVLGIFILFLVALIAWPAYLYAYGSDKMRHVIALSGAADTPGTTYLIVGSDAREGDSDVDGAGAAGAVSGHRADTIMLLNVPPEGTTSLISLPRDAYVEIPGHGQGKLNSAFSLGGEELLVQTVEQLSGLTVDRYIQVSMGGVANLVDAVGGINLCYDADVSDVDSGMEWTAGCHDVNGQQALAFSRMRKSDPLGDIGRTNRQRQVVSQLISKAASPSTLINPSRQRELVGAAADSLTTDYDTSLLDLARAGLALRGVLGEGGVAGVPPIADMNYRAKGQSNVLLDPARTPDFFAKVRSGTVTQADAIGISR